MSTFSAVSNMAFPSAARSTSAKVDGNSNSPFTSPTMTLAFAENDDGLFLKGNCTTISELYRQCVHTGDIEHSSVCHAAVQSYLRCSRSDK